MPTLCFPTTVWVFVASDSLDVRGSFDALAGAVTRLGLDPVDRHISLFLNRTMRLPNGLDRLKAPRPYGTTALALSSTTLIERLSRRTLRYGHHMDSSHGVLAIAARWRPRVVLAPRPTV